MALALVTAFATSVLCMTPAERDAARAIMLDGLELGLRNHVVDLYRNRLRDRDRDPTRIAQGVREAVAAYNRSRAVVLQWSPPACTN